MKGTTLVVGAYYCMRYASPLATCLLTSLSSCKTSSTRSLLPYLAGSAAARRGVLCCCCLLLNFAPAAGRRLQATDLMLGCGLQWDATPCECVASCISLPDAGQIAGTADQLD